MTDKIPQHSHCTQCGKAYIGEGRYCSDDCKQTGSGTLKKRKRQLLILYGVTLAVLILVVLMTA